MTQAYSEKEIPSSPNRSGTYDLIILPFFLTRSRSFSRCATIMESRPRDGAVVEHLPPTQASHQCGPGSIPGLGVICGLSLLLVFVLAPRCFSPGTPVFPSHQRPTFPNSNSIWIIVKHFIMSLWLGRLRKHSPCC